MMLCLCLFCRREEKGRAVAPEKVQADITHLRASVAFPGKIVFQSNLDGDNEIYLLSNDGLKKLTDNNWDDTYPRWSPDGKRIVFSANPQGKYNLFVMNENGENITQLTNSPEDDMDPAWAPDGRSIVFAKRIKKMMKKQLSIWILDLLSKSERKAIPDFRGSHILPDPSPSAPLLAFTGSRMIGWDVFVYDFNSRKYKGLTEGGKACRPRFSPDGQKIVYVSDKADGKGDIWLMNADGSNQQRLTERDETYDYFPSWSPDGKQVVFCSSPNSKYGDKGDWALYLVRVEDKKIIPLSHSPGRDIFPDWR
jgi:Tol biopolymer transport system component